MDFDGCRNRQCSWYELANHPHIKFSNSSSAHTSIFVHITVTTKITSRWRCLKHPTEQLSFSHFFVCGGSILFASTNAPLQICLLHHNIRDEWLLPKDRKDRGEEVKYRDGSARDIREDGIPFLTYRFSTKRGVAYLLDFIKMSKVATQPECGPEPPVRLHPEPEVPPEPG